LDEQLLDFKIIVGENVYQAHKVILAASSNYFKLVISNQMKEARENEVTIKDIDPHVMKAILEFCYTHRITLNNDNVSEFLLAASRFCIESLQDECINFIKRRIDASNCLFIIDLSERCNLPELHKEAFEFCLDNFDIVIEAADFSIIDELQWADLLPDDRLNISEKEVFEKLVEWTREDLEKRTPVFDRLIRHVRFANIDTLELIRLSTLDLAQSSDSCRNLIDMVKNYLLLKDHPDLKNELLTDLNVTPRDNLCSRQRIYAIGGWTEKEKALSHVEIYDPRTKKWTMAKAMRERRCGLGCAVLNNVIYAVGGHDGQRYLSSVERYETCTNEWFSDVPPMSIPRSSVGVVELYGYLYAIGGQNAACATSSVERYLPGDKNWHKCASMNQNRLGAAVTVLNGFIYVIGGAEMNGVFNSVEKYDPDSNSWSYVAPMKQPRKHHGCTTYNGKIYVIGGRIPGRELASGEVYDPQTDTWSDIPSMPTDRLGVSVVELDKHLYVVGGQKDESFLNIVESYDPRTMQWEKRPNMINERLAFDLIVHPVRKYT